MQVFLPTKNKIMFILKDAQCADQSFCIPKFFVWFLIIDLSSIFNYLKMVNSALELS